MQIALDEGLHLDKKDDSLYYFSTVPATRKKGTMDTHILYVRVKSETAYVSGTWDPHMGGNSGMFTMQMTNEPIMVKGWRTGGYIPNFILMDEFVHKLGDTVLYFIK